MKLTFVSFFHNITLPSELIFINTTEELEAFGGPPSIKKKIEEHALDSAKILTKFKSRVPLGLETIIKQHHGARDGIGFDSFSQNISPLALVFLVADEWATLMLKSEKMG